MAHIFQKNVRDEVDNKVNYEQVLSGNDKKRHFGCFDKFFVVNLVIDALSLLLPTLFS